MGAVGGVGLVGGVWLVGGPAAFDNSLLEAFILDSEVRVWDVLGAECSAFAEEGVGEDRIDNRAIELQNLGYLFPTFQGGRQATGTRSSVGSLIRASKVHLGLCPPR